MLNHSFTAYSSRKHHHKHFDSDSSSTNSSSDSSDSSLSDESSFALAEKRRHRELLDTIRPLNEASLQEKANKRDMLRADATPITIDPSVTWDSVGGLSHHVQALKEMILFPLLYPEVFDQFHIQPPRGVLFVGPPGTGKTLVARALCTSCSVV